MNNEPKVFSRSSISQRSAFRLSGAILVNAVPFLLDKAGLISAADARVLFVATVLVSLLFVVTSSSAFDWLFGRAQRGYPVVSLIIVGLLGATYFVLAWHWLGIQWTREVESVEATRMNATITKLEQDIQKERDRVIERDRVLGAKDTEIVQLRDALDQAKTREASLRTQLDDRERRKAVRNALGAFLAEGRQLLSECANEREPPPEQKAEDWAARTEAYLNEHLDAGHVALFRSGAGLPMTATSISSIPHRQLWSGIRVRVARLEQFISQLSAP